MVSRNHHTLSRLTLRLRCPRHPLVQFVGQAECPERISAEANRWASSCRHPTGIPLTSPVFFMENYEFWEDEYDVVNKIFQEACRGEINFWAAAADQSSLNK